MASSGFEGLLTGHTLADRYHVEEVIGRGGFAAVYRATDQRLGRTVAVKVITQSASNPEVRAEIGRRFEREARAIAMLHHPNVVMVYDFGADPVLGLDFLVMELLRGEVLSDRLRRAEPIPVPEALRILREAAAGVDAGHRAGLIHRDIKPGNVFLAQPDHGGPPRVVVVDFGIARFTEAQETTQLTHSGRGFLSPAYASPEQLRGERPVTPASDVFSLGVIGYHLLAREKPFAHDRMHPGPFDKPPAPLRERNRDVPPAVAAVIERAMRDDPAERFADAGAFVAALVEAGAADGQGNAPAVPAAVPAPDSTQLQPAAEVAVIEADVGAAAVAASPDDPAAEHAADGLADQEPVPAGDDSPSADFKPPPVFAAVAPAAAVTIDPPVPPRPASGADDRHAGADGVRSEPLRPAPDHAAPARTARRMSPALLAVPLLLVLGLVLWLALGRGGKNERVATDTPSTRPGSGDAPAGTVPAASGASAGESPAAAGRAPAGAGQAENAPPGRTAAAPSAAPPAGGLARAPATAPASVPARLPAGRPAAAAQTPASAPVQAGAGGPEAMALNRQGEGLFERGDLDAAIERFRAAVRAAPGNAYYRNNLGWALFQAGRVDEAGRELREAVRLDPRRDIAYANIGEVERAKGNIAAAIAAYERFLELNTDPRREQIAREKLRSLRGG